VNAITEPRPAAPFERGGDANVLASAVHFTRLNPRLSRSSCNTIESPRTVPLYTRVLLSRVTRQRLTIDP
jgi:hypothetical protein